MHIKKVELHRFKKFEYASIAIRSSLSLIAGSNNSGKSSVLQALATWQFCKTLLEIEKGRKSWLSAKNSSQENTELKQTKSGVGLSIFDFTPLQLPSLNHLWNNLKSSKTSDDDDGYTLRIAVYWDVPNLKKIDDDSLNSFEERHLEIGLSLANDRLFVRVTSSNLSLNEVEDADGNPIDVYVPRVAYLPPFAGITDKELKLSTAMRARLIGQGLSGGVIRNVLYDMYEKNKKIREASKEGKKRIPEAELKNIRENDQWEILQSTIKKIFLTELYAYPFNDRFHSYLRIETKKGEYVKKELKNKKYNYTYKTLNKMGSRDLMVEGSGFLQWLSVYALTLSDDVDVILLDEPDAHLNASLQKDLLISLRDVADKDEKQVLMATHSPELIRFFDHQRILSFSNSLPSYLTEDSDKVELLSGIGSAHTPTLHSIFESRKMIILEAESDLRFLKIFANLLGMDFPGKMVPWYWTGNFKERKQLFLQLSRQIPGLKCISLRDRDDEALNSVDENLLDKSNSKRFDDKNIGFYTLKWRRRNIEGYLLNREAIAKASSKKVEEIDEYFSESHSISLNGNYTSSEVAESIMNLDAKKVFTGKNGLKNKFKLKRENVIKSIQKSEVPVDILKFFEYFEEVNND